MTVVMEEAIKEALEKDRLVDITTTGRKTGMERRKEVGFHYLDGKVFSKVRARVLPIVHCGGPVWHNGGEFAKTMESPRPCQLS